MRYSSARLAAGRSLGAPASALLLCPSAHVSKLLFQAQKDHPHVCPRIYI